MIEIIAAVVILIGSIFLLLASIGLIRMPDIYNRMQAGTKASTLGSILIFLGFIMYNPSDWTKYLLLVLFIFFTNPISSHTLVRAAHYIGSNPLLKKYAKDIPSRDELREYKDGGDKK
ncbi:MAG: monovalent cation/H(+) antiporter subunit G [Spirochaetaceae bacterium]